ncbi:uncharacterized protein [Primulina eburnea]|uniref:uncharacterized protein isoform X3 n=1 Tax=Primulina eburnea TaxID=1245227 RepID=UPI003C6C7B58
MSDESLPSNQVPVQGFSCGISYGNYSHQGMTDQRSALPLESEVRQENEGWHELTLRKVLKPAPSDPDTSLDPLEQKFLYSTDENILGSSFSRSIDNGLEKFASTALEHASYTDRFPTIQSGSWSALMQSAVAETSSGDGGLQEEWSGLNFQNSELLTDNQTSNYIGIVKQNSNWVDTDLQNSSLLSVRTEIVPDDSNINGSSPGFQQSNPQYLRQKEGFHSESLHVSNQYSPTNNSLYSCQQKHPTGCSQLFQGSSFPKIRLGQRKEHSKNYVCHLSNKSQPGLNSSDHELRGTIWPHGSTLCEIQKPFDQVDHQMMVDQQNIHGYSIESEKISSGMNDEPIQVLRASSDLYSQSMIYQASNTMLDLLNKDRLSINHAPEMHLSAKISAHNESPRTETSVAACAKPCNNSPISLDQRTPQSSLPVGNSCSTYPSGHNVNDRFENQHAPASLKPIDLATNGLVYSSDSSMLKNANFISSELPVLKNQQVTQAAVTSVSSQHVGFPTGLFSRWVDVTTQPFALSSKPQKSPNFFRSLNSENISLKTSSVLPNEQPSINSPGQEYNAQGFCASSAKPEYHEQQLVAESFLQKDSTEIINSFSVSSYNHDQDLYRENHLEANVVASSSLMTQSHQPSNKLEQNDIESPYQSLISLQLAQYISKHDGTLKNGQLFPIYDSKAPSNTVKRFSGMAIESSMLPSIAATFIVSEQSSPNKLPSYATCQNMAVSKPKKRKVAFDMVPWHKEVKYDSFMLQNIRVAELEWAEASSRRPEEVKNEVEILEDMQSRFRAKRRLVFATQLMQQVFQPAPAVILSSDACSNCDGVTYFASRFSFADACLVTSNSQMPSDGNAMSRDKLKTYKRCTASDFSEAVEGLVGKVKKLEGELLRMDESLSIVDIKVESQELAKFSIINRFAKFHIMAQPTGADSVASNGTSKVSKKYPQRYVSAHPIPKTVPEGTDLLILHVKEDWGKFPEISASESGFMTSHLHLTFKGWSRDGELGSLK